MTQVPNQFSMSPQKGMLDMRFNLNVLSCVVKDDESPALVPGQAVKCVDNSTSVPTVTAVDDDADDIFGFVQYDGRRASYEAGVTLDIVLCKNSVMYLEADAAIAKWAKVCYVVTDEQVKTAVIGTTVVGRALDKATAGGQLIRVWLDEPELLDESSFVQAANVAALTDSLTGTTDGTIDDVADIALSTGDSYTDAAVNAAVNAAIADLNEQLKELTVKLNAEIAALKTAGLQASS